MENIFIGWSGNKNLAENIAKIINNNSTQKAIVGGGSPKDMFIGEQVLRQIGQSNFAILLVEDKEDGEISPNLMFEWGYIMAKLPLNNICTVLINKSPRELPSDLLGTWVYEIKYDKLSYNEEELTKQIYDIVQRSFGDISGMDYFDLIDRWEQTFIRLKTGKCDDETEKVECLLMGCLAAYYYMDNITLRNLLNNISGNVSTNEVITFAKAYIDLFIESANMSKSISQDTVFLLMQTYESILNRHKSLPEELDILLDVLCNTVYGLACSLFLKNENLDEQTQNFFSEKALGCYTKALDNIEMFNIKHKSECLNLLFKCYVHNDLAHLHLNAFKDTEKFKEYLKLSVEDRKQLHQSFISMYPNNVFLATKFEQEYIIALSEQCDNMEESFMKTMYKKMIVSKFNEWQKELVYTSSLMDRIAANIERIQ